MVNAYGWSRRQLEVAEAYLEGAASPRDAEQARAQAEEGFREWIAARQERGYAAVPAAPAAHAVNWAALPLDPQEPENERIDSRRRPLAAAQQAAMYAARAAWYAARAAGAQPGAGDRGAKLKAFCRTLTERAFRRPLTDVETSLLIDRQFEASASDPDLAVKRVVLLVLKSPRFLYPDAGTSPEKYATAARLAFALWDAPPDKELLDSAAAGKLGTHEELVKQAERMLAAGRNR